MATAPKTRTLTATRVRGCWAYCSRAAETTSWKSRSKMELTASFQLVENELNNYCLDSFFERQPFSDTDEWGSISDFYRVLVQYFVHKRGVYHGFAAQRLYSPFKLKVNTTDKSARSDPVLIIPPFQFKGQNNFNISEEHFCYYTPSPPPVCIKISPILQHTFS